MSRIFLGVDGGQSSTNAVIGDETGRILGSGRGGPSNHVGAAQGRARLMSAVTECLTKAANEAGIPIDSHFEACCLGFTGGPADKEAILHEMLNTGRLIVVSDAVIALSGATAGEPGIATIAGSGSVSYGRNGAGKTARAGGWGFSFGDEGSAYDIARQAIRAALRYEEGWGPSTVLHPMLLEATGIANMKDAVRLFYTVDFPRPRIASFAQLVNGAAVEGDRIAGEILEYAAHQLTIITNAVRNQLFEATETVPAAYVGGVFRSELLLGHYRRMLEAEGKSQVGPPRYGPAVGALIEAYRSAGINPKPTGLPSFDA
jgi:N-acetylglucosamine kinase-like BadF-type ATPase